MLAGENDFMRRIWRPTHRFTWAGDESAHKPTRSYDPTHAHDDPYDQVACRVLPMTVAIVSFILASALFFAIIVAGRELRSATRAHNDRAIRDFKYARNKKNDADRSS